MDSPHPGGGERQLGIPTVLDRLLQQALLQVWQPDWDKTVSDHRYGVRPGRSAHQAIARAQQYLADGYAWVVDLDLEQFFARVHHDKVMSLVKERIGDRRVSPLIDRSLKAGALAGDGFEATVAGMPQGGPRSPLFATLRRDGFDKALERRGHRVVRDADESTISVKSLRAGQRALARVTRFWERRLQRTGNGAKRAVAPPWRRPHRRLVSAKALQALQQAIRQRPSQPRGVALLRLGQALRQSLDGWYAYVRRAEGQSRCKALDSWIRRRRRCYRWKQWGRHRDRALRRRGGSQALAWNTGKSAQGPWRLSRSPALALALPGQYFDRWGVPRLYQRSRR